MNEEIYKRFSALHLFDVVVLCTIWSQCSKSGNTYYLLLMGESESWNLTGYEIVITPEDFKAGFGTLK